jgi:two-component system cell cycle sensor histidine kinase/response regulator CckA
MSSHHEQPERLAGTETVLLCEDEGLLRTLIERILTAAGYRVLSSRHPQQALELAATHGETLEIVVTDVMLPQMSGPELADRLRALCPGVRTLFLSGYTAETVRDLPPGSAFLQKPFDHDTLLRQVRNLQGSPTPLAPR